MPALKIPQIRRGLLFFAGTVKRAPLWWQNHGLEWLYRLLKEPRRMWRRYVVGNVKFLRNVGRERRGI